MAFKLLTLPHRFELSPELLPGDPALLAHCRRVSAVAKLVAHEMFLSETERHQLSAACLLHHYDRELMSDGFVKRLLADVGGQMPNVPRVDRISPAVRAVLSAFRHPRSGDAPARKLAEILRAADAFDQECEASPMDLLDACGVHDRLRTVAASGQLDSDVVEALNRTTTPIAMGDPSSWRIPVFPEAVPQMLNLLQNPQANTLQVVEAAGKDPATAGKVMQLANSGLFCGHYPVSTLSKAIVRLGFATAQKVVLSFAARPLLTSRHMDGLWSHSLEVADLAEQLACQTGAVDPAEAYLAGLLHDVGRIVLPTTSVFDRARLRGLEQMGCPAVYSENLILRTDHAKLGACVAAEWRLPTSIVEAIQDHHCPEAATSRLAHLLYVAEYLSDAEEDLPSALRLECALRGIGVTVDEIDDCSVSALGTWLAAA